VTPLNAFLLALTEATVEIGLLAGWVALVALAIWALNAWADRW
jgi:hypothetical protein